MATYSSAQLLAASQSRRFRVVRASIRVEHKNLVSTVADQMVDLASGRISTRELRRRGHPFARRRRKGRSVIATPKLPINRQTGALIRSLRIIPEHQSNKQTFRVQFTAPHAKFVLALGGTKRMVARGYWVEMRKRGKRENAKTVYQMRLLALKLMYAS